MHRPEDDNIGKLILQGFREIDGLGYVVVRGDGSRTLYFEVSGVPKLRLVIQADKSGMSGIGAEDPHAREFLVQCPDEFVHVDVGVRCGWHDGERNIRDGNLFVADRLEAGQIGRIAYAHGTVLVRGHQALKLEGDETGYAVGLVASNE